MPPEPEQHPKPGGVPALIERPIERPGEGGFVPLRIISRRYHFHLPGVVYVVTTLIIVVGAVNGQNNLLFWLFGLAVGGLVISGIVSGASLMGVRLERSVADRMRVGETSKIRYRCGNRNRLFPVFALLIEELPDPFKDTGPPTWKSAVEQPTAFCPGVRAGETRVSVADCLATARGPIDFVAVRVSSTFPFGITRKSVVFAARQSALVWPRAIPATLTLGAHGGIGEEPLATARHRGSGDVVGLREYRSGDSARSIAWKPTSRLGRPIVRELAPPASQRVWLVCELAQARDTHHADALVSTVVGLAEDAAKRGIRAGLADADGIVRVPMGTGPRHDRLMLDALALVRIGGDRVTGTPEIADGSRLTITASAGGPPGSRLVVPPPAAESAPAPRRRRTLARTFRALWVDWLAPRRSEARPAKGGTP